jgi:hypothetical protein
LPASKQQGFSRDRPNPFIALTARRRKSRKYSQNAAAWQHLPEAVKAGIDAMVTASRGRKPVLAAPAE